jgi:hypothetical protein
LGGSCCQGRAPSAIIRLADWAILLGHKVFSKLRVVTAAELVALVLQARDVSANEDDPQDFQ